MTTESELMPSVPELPELPPTQSWDLEFERLRSRFPGAQPSVLFCVHALQQSADVALEDLKAQAQMHGLRVTGSSQRAARRLLGLEPRAMRRGRRKSAAPSGAARAAAGDEFTKATAGTRFCIARLREDPTVSLATLRREAAAAGVKLNNRSLASARRLLGLGAPAPAAAAAMPAGLGSDWAPPEVLASLRQALATQQHELARLRRIVEAIRRALAS